MSSLTADEFLAQLQPHAFGWPPSLRFTYDTVRQLIRDDVAGSLVECGVGNGVHPAAMWKACRDADATREILLFDSFQGVPHGGEHDTDWNAAHGDSSGRLESSGVAACSYQQVQDNLRGWGCEGRFVFYPGWFQETLPRARPHLQPIAFLRLDADLYDGYLSCLSNLYDICSPGAVIVCDDLNLDGCRHAVREFGLDLDAFMMITNSGDGWIRKP